MIKLLLTFFTLFILSCSSTSGPLGKRSGSTSNMTFQKYEEAIAQGLGLWKNRYRKSSLLKFIDKFESCAGASEDYDSQILSRYKIYERLGRAYYLLGYNHQKDLAKSKKSWQMGASWAEKALYTNHNFKEAVGKYGEFTPALSKVQDHQVGALYWYLANIGMWSKNSGVSTTLKYIKLIKSMLRRISQTDPNYHYGGLDRYRGAYFAVLPSYAGGNITKSRDHFIKSLRVGPEYLGTKVLYAMIYAQKTKNKPLFKKLLKEVVESPAVHDPDIRAENLLEKKKATVLLKKMNDLF